MLSRYNVYRPALPFLDITPGHLSSTMSRLFEELETAHAGWRARPPELARPAAAANVQHTPRVELRDAGDAIWMVAELPGLGSDEIELGIEGGVVSLKTTPKEKSLPEGFKPLRRERRPVALNWSFELPYPVDAAAVTATLEHGRLSVTLPKAPEAKPRTIPVRTS